MVNERIGYRGAVTRQPESLAHGLETVAAALEAIDLHPFHGKSVGFAGIGASYQAGMVGACYLRLLGIPSFAYCPTDLYQAVDSAAEAFVALSASGQSREISDVMALRAHMPRIAICRSGGNPLRAEHCFETSEPRIVESDLLVTYFVGGHPWRRNAGSRISWPRH